MTTQALPKCPVCGAELPGNAPQGLCPKCLLMGVTAQTEPGTQASAHNPAPSLEEVRAAFPHLEIIELIGQGGMGAVFKARQPKLNRLVALKILPQAMSQQPAFAERFAREAQMLARLNHPNIVTVHDFGQAGEFFYLLMEYVDGVNLRQAMRAGRFTPEQALAIVPMICEALQYAHDEGVLHRDVKPENILLDVKGRVRLVDFGIAKLAAAPAELEAQPTVEKPADAALTQTGSALGTPQYMAPEQQVSPSTVDQRADIYSLGVVFYEMLTGELPVGRFPVPSLKTPVDPRVDDVVMRAMARQKEERYASASAVRTSIEAIAAEPKITVPAAAEGHAVPLTSFMKNVLLVEFAVLVLFMAHEVMGGAPLMLRQMLFVMQTGVAEAVVGTSGLVVIAWLGSLVWRRQHWMLAPFQDRSLWTPRAPGTTTLASGSRDEWLRFACLAFIAVLALQVLWIFASQVMLIAQAAARHNVLLVVLLPTGATLMPAVIGVVLVWWLAWRELRRTDVFPPSPAPAWLSRLAAMLLALAILTFLPSALPRDEIPTTVITFGGVFGIAALPLLTRSRLWRAIGIAVLVQLLFVAVPGLALFAVFASDGRFPAEWSARVGPISAVTLGVIMQLISIFCYGISLAALLLPQTAAAFGIGRREAAIQSPASPSHAAA